MKKYFAILFVLLLAACSDVEKAESFAVGKQTIQEIVPDGFTSVTPKLGKVYEFYDSLQKSLSHSTNGMLRPLRHYVILQDLKQATKEITRNCYIAENVAANSMSGDSPFTEKQFNEMVNEIKQHESRVKTYNYIDNMKGKMLDSMNEDMQTKFDNKLNFNDISVNNDFLIIEEQKHHFSYIISAYVTMNDKQTKITGANSILNLKGKIMNLYCYAAPSEVEWLKKITLDWAKKLQEANP